MPTPAPTKSFSIRRWRARRSRWTNGQLEFNDTTGETLITGSSDTHVAISGNNISRVLYINNAAIVAISDLSIVDGYTADGNGGGIYSDGVLTVIRSNISGNTAAGGGGGIAHQGTLVITDSIISENTSVSGDGSGIYSIGGTLTISGSTVSKNFQKYYNGGGICNLGGTLTITHSTISENSTDLGGYGGGIYNSGTAIISESTISKNSAACARDGGGGIYNIGVLTITSSTISENTVNVGWGGRWNLQLWHVGNERLHGREQHGQQFWWWYAKWFWRWHRQCRIPRLQRCSHAY